MENFKHSAMHQFRVNKTDLLSALNKNLETHRDNFLEAQEAYKQRVVQELEQALKDAREGTKIRTAFNLPQPTDHTDDYKSAIRRLEMCIDDTITIDEDAFNQYVMDQWGWKHQFAAIANTYTGKSYK